MVSGFLTSPWDHSRIFSGDASEMRIALNDSGSLGFSKKLKMSRIGAFPFSDCLLKLWILWIEPGERRNGGPPLLHGESGPRFATPPPRARRRGAGPVR